MTSAPDVSVVEGEAMVREGALLLDVREPEEWHAGHAPEAQWLRMGEIPSHFDTLPRDRRIVAICRSGNRSGRVADFLTGQGFDCVNLAGGMMAWEAAGFAVVDDAGSPGIVA